MYLGLDLDASGGFAVFHGVSKYLDIVFVIEGARMLGAESFVLSPPVARVSEL